MHFLKLHFSATECNGWPKLKFLIDLDQIEDVLIDSSDVLVSVPLDLLDGDHVLSIELYDKKPNNTIVDQKMNIIQDQTVELIDMSIDNIKLPEYFKYLGVYYYNDIPHPQASVWGINGVWKWNFQTPIITWLLDKKTEQNIKYNQNSIEHKENLKSIQTKIQNFLQKLDEL